MSDRHSELLSPSASGLWIPCTAMPGEKKRLNIQDNGSVAAERGTLQHYYAEQLETGAIKQEDFAKYTSSEPTDTLLTMSEWVDTIASNRAIKDLLDSYPSKKFRDYNELAVGFSGWREDCFGTLDRSRLDLTNRILFVFDHKFGAGPVPAKGCSQLLIYALALLEVLRAKTPKIDTMIDTVIVGISQPKIKYGVDYEVLSIEELLQWDRDVLQPAQRAVLDGTGVFTPGPHCKSKYCKVRYDCQAFSGEACNAMDDFMAEFHNTTTDQPSSVLKGIDDVALQDRLDKIPIIESIIDMIREEAESRIRNGIDLERYKIVNGKGRTGWSAGEEDIAKVLKGLKFKATEMFKKSILTPAQAKDALRAQERLDGVATKKLDAVTEYQPGKEKLVPVTDKGEAIKFNVASAEDETDDLLADILGEDVTSGEEDFSDFFNDI